MTSTTEILVLGGGITGLAIARALGQRGAQVTVLNRNPQEAATLAAAGMLAPQAEGIPPGPLLDLGLLSRSLYPAWVGELEATTGKPTGYWPCGILAPSYEPPTLPPQEPCLWWNRDDLQHYQPDLGDDVIGGWWYPADGQVDNRALALALLAAVEKAGITVHQGVTVKAMEQHQGRVTKVHTSAGDWQAEHYILAAGAWSPELLPMTVYPLKGQMAAVRIPPELGLPLQRVLFGPETYLVPRRDGRVVIGATSEKVGWTPHNTPMGLASLFQRAARLYPAIAQFPVEECWWGYRPSTPDEGPILGPSHCDNLTLATGHHRNGILLAPATAQLIADWVEARQGHPLLAHFHWQRLEASLPPSLETSGPSTAPPLGS